MLLAIATALLLVAGPLALFMAGGIFMMRATGRARFRQRRNVAASVPLNFRFGGYDAAEASAYWQWLGPEGRAAEVRFLKADMVFPLWYGGSMLGSTWAGWLMLERPLSLLALALPLLVAIVADWIENAVHLRQLAAFDAGRAPDRRSLRIASRATTTKLGSFGVATGIIVLLACGVTWRGVQA
jgi:hypothetical protein